MPSAWAASSASAISMAKSTALVHVHGPSRNAVLQRHTVQELHHDIRLTVFLADVINRADVRVIERGSRLRFSAEPFECLRVVDHIFGKELEGDEAMEPRVLGFVNHTHSTAAELLDDAVVRNRPAKNGGGINHRQCMLGCDWKQVNLEGRCLLGRRAKF